ncbi:MAG: lipoate--protein ligase family protein [Candidatus Bathyarchaeota archaeon]|nr:MAG: lipoate--protein ligase family protein [Candidatus Bathyarchaeota archaeon]
MKCVGKNAVPCTLRFWRNPKAVVIGSFQCPELEVDIRICREKQIPIIRRVTGGGAVYHDEGTLNYSIFTPKSHRLFSLNFLNLFENVNVSVAKALHSLGLRCASLFSNAIVVGDKKIAGIAGAVKDGAMLIHGSLLINSDLNLLSEVLLLQRGSLKVEVQRKFTRSQRMDVINLEHAIGRRISLNAVKSALRKAFEELFSVKFIFGGLIKAEEALSRDLLKNKYSTKHWNFKYSRELA